MNAQVLFVFAISLWLCVVLTGCSYMAMGIELRRSGKKIKWWSFSFSVKTRIETCRRVIESYRDMKRDRHEFPIFLWAMALCGSGIVILPIVGLLWLIID